jgi:hypothetical protein
MPSDRAELDAACVQLVQEQGETDRGAAEAVDALDGQCVAGPQRREGGRQSRPLHGGAGDVLVLVDRLAAIRA